VDLRRAEMRTTAGLAGTGLSNTHIKKSRHNAFNAAPGSEIPAAEILKGKAGRGWPWTLLLVAIAVSRASHGPVCP
jgi:hypothetical protein